MGSQKTLHEVDEESTEDKYILLPLETFGEDER